MSLIVTIGLILGLLVGGGAGLAHAADEAVPGEMLYGLDRAVESLQYALSLDPASQSQNALGFAEERLSEIMELASENAPADLIGEAAMGYLVDIDHLIDTFKGVDGAEVDGLLIDGVDLDEFLLESLSSHVEVLSQVRDEVPDEAKASIDLAIERSLTGNAAVEEIFAEGLPNGMPGDLPDGQPEGSPSDPPEGLPDGIAETVPAGPPEDLPDNPPEDAQDAGAPDITDIESRIENLFAWTEEIKSLADEGQIAELEVALGEYENEVDDLALALSEMATEDEARVEALMALLEEALARHGDVLNELLINLPDISIPFIDEDIEIPERGRGGE